jgi:hypothetical protein
MRFATMLLLLVLVPDAARCAQVSSAEAPQSARQLIKDVIYNELQDRERDSFWEYRSHAISEKKDILREQVETAEGPVYRVLASHGQELEGAQAVKEERRLADYVHDPAEVAKVRRSHESDEARLAHVMQLIPHAYVFEYEGATTGDRVRLRFAPNPAFVPASYEDRILYGLGGEMVVDQRLKRMISMDGTIRRRIDFGYGLLGSVEPGGTFEIHRTQVSPTHWKTDLVNVHVQGKIFLFSDISKNQEETRWGFTAVPQDISLEQARETLNAAAASYLASAERAAR